MCGSSFVFAVSEYPGNKAPALASVVNRLRGEKLVPAMEDLSGPPSGFNEGVSPGGSGHFLSGRYLTTVSRGAHPLHSSAEHSQTVP